MSRQAAHSLPCDSCIRSCSAIAVSVNVIKPCAREKDERLTALWSLTQQAQQLVTQLAMNPPRSAGDGRQEIKLTAMVPIELPVL